MRVKNTAGAMFVFLAALVTGAATHRALGQGIFPMLGSETPEDDKKRAPAAGANDTKKPLATAGADCVINFPSRPSLNLRETPRGEVLGSVKNGSSVKIQEVKNDDRNLPWAQIGSGWVFAKFLDCRASTQPVPRVSGAPAASRREDLPAARAAPEQQAMPPPTQDSRLNQKLPPPGSGALQGRPAESRTLPSKEQTVRAIIQIYGEQGDCSERDKAATRSYTKLAVEHHADQLKFSSVEKYEDMSEDTTTSPTLYVATEYVHQYQHVFNPADIDYTKSVFNQIPRVLRIHCAQEKECVETQDTSASQYCFRYGKAANQECSPSIGENDTKRAAAVSIRFCDASKLERIHKALLHLSTFSSPTPKLPF